jgi:pyruvyl transferase EpsO
MASSEFRTAMAGWIPVGADVAIVDVPVHRNIGDLFILAATHHLLSDLNCRVVYAAGRRDYRLSAARRALTPNAIIIGLGGGNFGDRYPAYQVHRERVAADFQDHRIVVLPQTLHFRDPNALAHAVECFRRHRDLRIAVRDAASLDLARQMTPHAMLLPDIVDVLGPTVVAAHRGSTSQIDSRPPLSREGTLVLRRRDSEGRPEAERRDTCDWADLFPGFDKQLTMAALLMSVAPATLSAHLHVRWSSRAVWMLQHAVRLMQHAERVETDRLHAAIVARIASRPVTIVDNGYGKLRAYYEAWWRHDRSVTFADQR